MVSQVMYYSWFELKNQFICMPLYWRHSVSNGQLYYPDAKIEDGSRHFGVKPRLRKRFDLYRYTESFKFCKTQFLIYLIQGGVARSFDFNYYESR